MFRFGGKSHLEEQRPEQVRGGALGRLQSSRWLWEPPLLDLTPVLHWMCLESTYQWLLPVSFWSSFSLYCILIVFMYFIFSFVLALFGFVVAFSYIQHCVLTLCHCSSLSPHFPLGGLLLLSCIFPLSRSPSTVYTNKHTAVFFQTNHLKTFSFLIFVE